MNEILLRQLKHDGHCYRHHLTKFVDQVSDGLVLYSPSKTEVWDSQRSWQVRNDVYHYLWNDRWYNLLEVFTPAGELLEIYVHIASPYRLTDGEVSYIDYELDVTNLDGPRLVDEDEFADAVVTYGYSAQLQAQCYAAAEEALALVERWQPGLPPAEALAQVNGIGA